MATTPAHERMIEMHNVIKRYGKVTVLDNINLDVFRGEVLSIVGDLGSGKTTLLRQVMGLKKPSSGTVHIFGEELACQVGNDLQSICNRRGIQFQHGALFSVLLVIDNVALPMRELCALPDASTQCMAILRLWMVGLKSTGADRVSSDLSGGMAKCVTFTWALSLELEPTFLNEPTAELDPRTSNDYVALIRESRQELDLTVAMVTHGPDTLVALSDHIAMLASCRVMATKSLDQIIQIDYPFTKEYFLDEWGKWALLALGSQMTEAVAAAPLSARED